MKRFGLFFLVILFQFSVRAQTPPAGLDCNGMRVWLKQTFYLGQHQTLDYSTARKKMYAYVDNHNDTITCVYSGYKVYNPYGNEVSYPAPINTEHTVPQSFFNEGLPMRSDMHHLFPTYDDWNNERADNPFREIPDNQTTKWMYLGNSQTTIPTTYIDRYSESDGSTFEPREIHKGNLARAVMYFFTMYPTEAGDITSVADVDLLLLWNEEDPVDAAETARNLGVQQYQGNLNPYILHPEWAPLAWGTSCIVGTEDIAASLSAAFCIPNPCAESATLHLDLKTSSTLSLRLMNMNGSLVYTQTVDHAPTGIQEYSLPVSSLPTGPYALLIKTDNASKILPVSVNH